MPITEPPNPGTLLSQGDILKGVRLFFSKQGADASWECASDGKVNLCLVLSRQCVVEHKPLLTVAAVEKYPGNTPSDQDFKSALLFLQNLRDGNKSPDLFYLGQLPGMQGRFCARLDFVTTIEMPRKPADRQTFVDENRVAMLHKDYARDLHIRVHQAFAKMGFEDYQWLSDADLKWLIATGMAEVDKEKVEQKKAEATREAEGRTADAKQITKDSNRIEEITKAMEPYDTEWARRYPGPPPKPAVPDSPVTEARAE